MFIDSIIRVIFFLTVEGFFYGHSVFFYFCKVDFDLTDWHFGDELIHVHFFLCEDWITEFLPYLFDDVKTSVHLVVLRLHLL